MSDPVSSPAPATPSTPLQDAVVWYHADNATHVGIAAHLANLLASERPGTQVIVTTNPDIRTEATTPANLRLAELPSDRTSTTRGFLKRWLPDLCIWSVGGLRPNVLGTVHRQNIPIYLIDADHTRLDSPGWRWLPNAQKTTFRQFDTILARNAATETHIRRKLGVKDATIQVTGPIRQEIRPLPCHESDREDLVSLLLGRPIWLAAHVETGEVTTVLQAHRTVIHRSHRVLLVLSPRAGTDMDAVKEKVAETGLRHIRWSEGAMPTENTQVILADTPEELGLWYRLAPVSFMGRSLLVGHAGADPLEPAAHGSAILYGPNVRDHLDTYSRLAELGGARIVRDAETLATAVQRTLPADQSATMAHAAWDVATQSAAVMDQLLDMVLDRLDRRMGA